MQYECEPSPGSFHASKQNMKNKHILQVKIAIEGIYIYKNNFFEV